MSERKLTNAYWMEVGALRERERILAALSSQICDCSEDCDRIDIHAPQLISLIKNDPIRELQQLAEETGEHEHFDNPLIDDDYNRLDNPIIGGVQKLNDLLGIIGK
ncbi:hypothetical protein UFOVP111_43 [uncultured Caudovirales phage]|uniref:Uncharacterized protein n=1 Tax=uncultured Caudovirales phage TaxID=2100421 RepID=A0A6J5L172_9CAUD|nr:hypothetical protein UFOVP111_43 [uncultured Caudovirales phage]